MPQEQTHLIGGLYRVNKTLSTSDPLTICTATHEAVEQPIGPWSDIYQLGLVLFTMITGRLPFVGKDIQETAILQKDKPLPALRQYKRNISATLQEILQHATQKDRHSRFANAAALIRALATVQQEQPIQASGPMMALQIAANLRITAIPPKCMP